MTEPEAPKNAADDTWTHVSGPDEAATKDVSSAPASRADGDLGGRRATRRRRPARLAEEDTKAKKRFLLVVLIVTLGLGLAAAAGGYLVERLSPATQVTQTVTPTPTIGKWPVALPVTVGEYSRNANEGASPSIGQDKKQTVSAQYTKSGADPVIVVLSRPETDGPAFMAAANMNAVGEVDNGWCGISGDNGLDGCAVIVDGTAVMVVALTDIGRTPLMQLTQQVADQVSGA